MKLHEAKQLKIGNKVYHNYCVGTTATILGPVKTEKVGDKYHWEIRAKDNNGIEWTIIGKYAFNWSITPTKCNP